MANTRCPLLDLPPELRNRIYDLILQPYVAFMRNHHHRHEISPPPLLQVNKLVRAETLPMFYANTLFDFSQLNFDLANLQLLSDWFSSLGDQAIKNLRQVRVNKRWGLSAVRDSNVVFTPQGDAEGRLVVCEVPRVREPEGTGLYAKMCLEESLRKFERMKIALAEDVNGVRERPDGQLTAEDWIYLTTVIGC